VVERKQLGASNSAAHLKAGSYVKYSRDHPLVVEQDTVYEAERDIINIHLMKNFEGAFKKTTVNGCEDYWLRCRFCGDYKALQAIDKKFQLKTYL
jgi:hypothetical protein